MPPGFERVANDRYCFFVGPMERMTMVQRLRLDADGVEPAVAEVRELARERDRTQVAWWVAGSATPPDLEQRLRDCGLEPATMPLFEPRYSALALVRPPAGAPATTPARRVESFDEFVAAWEIAWEAFEHDEEDRAGTREVLPMLYELERQDVSATYLAFLDGEPAGCATAVFAEAGVMMVGGATLPDGRGRGCYRALVEARWRDAVERGTPALVVQAGAMSAPILRRLDFDHVSELCVLVDELG